MATPTAIEVTVDAEEYSRYEAGKETITATVTVVGGAPYSAEPVRVDLIKARRSRDAVVATATVQFDANVDPARAEVEFYLPDIVDQDLINLVRHGKYFVRATETTNDVVYGDSDDFYVSVVSVERLKRDFLFGIDLKATEQKKPKFQPTTLPVTIIEMTKTHPLGFYTLTYNYVDSPLTNASSNIGSGVNGTVTTVADGGNSGESGNDYAIEVVLPVADGPMSVSLSGTDITVTLGVTGGVPDPSLNTATLIAAEISLLTGFTATASGTGADSISAAAGPIPFTGGTSSIHRSLSWGGGTAVSIMGTGVYILPLGVSGAGGAACSGSNGGDYIVVRVTSFLGLPEYSVTEQLMIDRDVLDDATLRRFVEEAIGWIENDFLNVYVEPTNVVTDRDPTTLQYSAGINAPTPIFADTDFDVIASPLTYFVPRTPGAWVQIQTPHPQLLRVDSLFGAIANTRVIDIDIEWIEHAEQTGLIQLVPFNQEIAFDFVGLLWVNAIRGATELPNFWHYNLIAGLRDAPAEIQEMIGKKAAVNALIVAGMALRPGVGSVSLSRDGVSESVSYTTSAEYGIYTGTIKAYLDWVEKVGQTLRSKYRGALLTVV